MGSLVASVFWVLGDFCVLMLCMSSFVFLVLGDLFEVLRKPVELFSKDLKIFLRILEES